MASGQRNAAGVDFDNLFDPDVTGDGYTATFLRRSDGTALRYANVAYGTAGPNVNRRDSGGVDVATRWAAKGTAVYALPINNASYYSNNQARGTSRIRFTLFGNGTYQVVNTAGAEGSGTVVASGTWLPAGDNAANWTVAYEAVELGHSYVGSDGVSSGVTNQAQSAVAVSNNPYCDGYALAIYTTTDSSSHGYLRIRLYRAGALRSTTTISYSCNVNGN